MLLNGLVFCDIALSSASEIDLLNFSSKFCSNPTIKLTNPIESNFELAPYNASS